MNWKKIKTVGFRTGLFFGLLIGTTGCGAFGTEDLSSLFHQAVEGDSVSKEADSASGFSVAQILGGQSEMDGWVTEKPTANLSGFAHDQLSAAIQQTYAQLYTGLIAYKSEIYVDCEHTDDIETAFHALLDDHPEIFWTDGEASLYGGVDGGKQRVTPKYNVETSQIPELQSQIEASVRSYLSSLPEDAVDYLKVRTAYQFVIRNTDYVLNSSQSQNIQSVFLTRNSVCAGYAKAFQYLLSRAGVECHYVHGTITESGEAHAWNLVKIEGIYTWVDPTWGDPTYGENEDDSARLDVIYDYLCMTSEELLRTGHVPDVEFSYPECSDMRFDFYYLLGDYLEAYDPQTVQQHLYATVNAGESVTYLKFSSDEAYQAAVAGIFGDNGLIQDPLQQKMRAEGMSSIQYFYSNSDELRTIKIFW